MIKFQIALRSIMQKTDKPPDHRYFTRVLTHAKDKIDKLDHRYFTCVPAYRKNNFVRGETRLYNLTFLPIILGMPVIATIIFLYILLNPLLWGILLLYSIWYYYDKDTPWRGSRASKFVRNLRLWKYCGEYFDAELVKTTDLPVNRNYIFACHPHGAIGIGTILSFGTEATGLAKAFSGLKFRLVTLPVNFYFPIHREIFAFMGVIPSDAASIEYTLNIAPHGRAVAIVPGGAEEAMDSHSHNYDLTLKERKGFVKLAIRNGASLVPVYNFGENKTYHQLPNERGSFVRKVQTIIKRATGISPIVVCGAGFFNNHFGLIPRSVKITTVGGMTVENVGIKAIQIYFPKNYVSQDELEKYDGNEGKYTKGLGQDEMSFCYDNEDVNSIALTVTANLLKTYDIRPDSIGYLSVGTETLVDKSKSVKSQLMMLFDGSNTDIEGIDMKNACFGGTQALFGAIDWIKANHKTDQRFAIAVMADIAVYSSDGPRCTGGAGAIALLVGPDAPIVIEDGLRACFMRNSWDFYKPIGGIASEYPIVEGEESLNCYLSALDACYSVYKQKTNKIIKENRSLTDFHSVLFHCPFYKLVQKAFARLVFTDYVAGQINLPNEEKLEQFKDKDPSSTYSDREFASETRIASLHLLQEKVEPNMTLNRRIGNMYTPSLYAQLFTLLSRTDDVQSLNNQRVLLFSYGSGLASAMFSIFFNLNTKTQSDFEKMRSISKNAINRLDEREKHSPELYNEIMMTRQKLVERKGAGVPTASLNGISQHLFPGTYYLTKIDDKSRRSYDQVQ
ncbi:hypothetical protein FO519_006567 [Halicephalobus sp. NKZ332]|nr:hypothetical protein FO519_006567 [Halicephalobus sp. NKZ332]